MSILDERIDQSGIPLDLRSPHLRRSSITLQSLKNFSTEREIWGSFLVSNDGKLDIAQAFRLILMMFWST